MAIATAFGNWLFTGETTPFTSLIPAGGAMLVLGFALVMLALIADMLGRQRKIQEEILYRLKKQEIEKEEKNDWGEQLPREIQDSIMEGIDDIQKGNTFLHDQVIQEAKQKYGF